MLLEGDDQDGKDDILLEEDDIAAIHISIGGLNALLLGLMTFAARDDFADAGGKYYVAGDDVDDLGKKLFCCC